MSSLQSKLVLIGDSGYENAQRDILFLKLIIRGWKIFNYDEIS
jgi:hypothetical protein